MLQLQHMLEMLSMISYTNLKPIMAQQNGLIKNYIAYIQLNISMIITTMNQPRIKLFRQIQPKTSTKNMSLQ